MGEARPLKIALIGNPNSGKTSVFNALTGMNQKVGNFPGVTVDRKTAELRLPNNRKALLVDMPGTYSLYPSSDDERVACEVLRSRNHPDHPDLLLVVVDATQLKRSLLLATQATDLGIPVLVAVNMVDLLEKDHIRLDVNRLARQMRVPVVATAARQGKGIDQLREALGRHPLTVPGHILALPHGFEGVLSQLKTTLGTQNDYLAWQALLRPAEFPELPAGMGAALQQEASIINPNGLISNEMLVRYDRIEGFLQGVLSAKAEAGEQRTERIDRWLLHKYGGFAIFIVVLMLIFQAIFSWASYPMDRIENAFAGTGTWLSEMLPDAWYSHLLVDGIWAGIGGIVVFVPQIALMAFFIALLEESGYMSRVIFLMDRVMRPFGFSGRAMMPLIGGMACAIPSIMATRTIPNRKERLITIMVTPLMSCSARIPVYILLIGLFIPATPVLGIFTLQGLAMMGLYVLGFAMALVAALVFKIFLKYQQDSIFVTELPIYRRPRWKNVALTVYQKCRTFVIEAGKIILVISVVLWFMAAFAPGNSHQAIDQQYDSLAAQPGADQEQLSLDRTSAKLEASYVGVVGKAIEPAIRPMGFDWKIGISLITSFAAREVFVGTMATIYSAGDVEANPDGLRTRMLAERNPRTGKPVYTFAVACALLVFYAFAMQCMSTLAVTKRETGSWKWVIIMLVYLTALAYLAAWGTFTVLS